MKWMTARRNPETPKEYDARGPYDVDYGRVIHSSSFRRLQGKTQILNLGDSDFYRTRLTHTLEVAQIGVGLLLQLRRKRETDKRLKNVLPDAALMHSICLVHDLGHPPFGHGGEVALNYCMRDHGGFEGNAHTLRILTKLEKFSSEDGSNLTRRCLLGVLKYPVAFSNAHNRSIIPRLHDCSSARIVSSRDSKPPKCHFDTENEVVSWLLEPFKISDRSEFQKTELRTEKHAESRHKTFDCSIMELADDISYGVHDFEDAIAIGLIQREQLEDELSKKDCVDFLKVCFDKTASSKRYPEFIAWLFGDSSKRKHAISRLVGYFVNNIEIREESAFISPLLRLRVGLAKAESDLLENLKGIVRKYVIESPEVRHLEAKGQNMVLGVFEALAAEPQRFLPVDWRKKFDVADDGKRVICDYVAGMTDNHLMRFFERLYSPRMGSVFDRL